MCNMLSFFAIIYGFCHFYLTSIIRYDKLNIRILIFYIHYTFRRFI